MTANLLTTSTANDLQTPSRLTPGQTVWILNHYAGTATSPSTRHFDIARELVKRGHRVTIFAAGFHYQRFVEERLAPGQSFKFEDHDGVRFVWLKTFPYRGNEWRRAVNMLSFAWRAISVGRRLDERPSVIVGSSVHPLAAVAAYVLSRIKKSRFVFEVRDLWPQTLIDMGAIRSRSPFAWALRRLEKGLYDRAEKIITLLPLAHEYITRLGVPLEKIVWIPNGADFTRYEGIEPYNGGAGEQFTIMYTGAHGRANALDVILDAAGILQRRGTKRIRFVFVGDGGEKPKLQRRAEQERLGNVEFRASVSKNELFKVMGEADSFIFNLEDLALFRYGISANKLFDYLSSGRPIVFSGNTGNNPVKEAGAGISVPARSPEMLAEAIIKLASLHPVERIQMGKNGLAYMKANHDIRQLSSSFERVMSASE
jgi:glycosyltransferase involved in cell wall biosynthesis